MKRFRQSETAYDWRLLLILPVVGTRCDRSRSHPFHAADGCRRFGLLPLLLGLLIGGPSALALAAETNPLEEPAERKYQEGPLSAKDYRAPAPDSVPAAGGFTMHAATATRVSYTYDSTWTAARGRFAMTLKKIEFVAFVQRDRSWNTQPGDRHLLEHEQGHFDLAELAARRAQATFDKLRVAHQDLVGRGNSKAAAQNDLDQLIQKKFQPILDAFRAEEQRYDRLTLHGANWMAQAEERKKQKDLLRSNETRAKEPAGR